MSLPTFIEVMPEGTLEVLSQQEVNRLRSSGEGGQHELLRRCALAILNSGSTTDDMGERVLGLSIPTTEAMLGQSWGPGGTFSAVVWGS